MIWGVAASNAAYFALAAGLAHQTKNDTLAKQAASTYEVLTKLGLIDDKFNIYDGCHTTDDCETINRLQISENAGLLLTGAAYMLNQVSLRQRPLLDIFSFSRPHFLHQRLFHPLLAHRRWLDIAC